MQLSQLDAFAFVPGEKWTDPTFGYAPEPTAETPTSIFIVGMPRSGSSLVEQILASHTEVRTNSTSGGI